MDFGKIHKTGLLPHKIQKYILDWFEILILKTKQNGQNNIFTT